MQTREEAEAEVRRLLTKIDELNDEVDYNPSEGFIVESFVTGSDDRGYVVQLGALLYELSLTVDDDVVHDFKKWYDSEGNKP